MRVGRDGGGAIVVSVSGLELLAGLRQESWGTLACPSSAGCGAATQSANCPAAGSGANQTCSPAGSSVFGAAHDAVLCPDGIEVIGTQLGAAAQAFRNF